MVHVNVANNNGNTIHSMYCHVCWKQIDRELNFTKLGHTVLPICANHLITSDHHIPSGCNTLYGHS